MKKEYAKIKEYIKRRFLGQKPQDDTGNFYKIQADADALKNTLGSTGWAKLSDRLSESFLDGLSDLFARLRDGNYDKDKLLVQTGIILARLEVINTIHLMLEDGKIATEALKQQAEPQSVEEYANQ